MSALSIVVLAACVCYAYGGVIGAPAAAVGYAAPALAAPAVGYAAPALAAHAVGYAAPALAAPAVSYAAPAIAAAPAVSYAAPVAVAAPAVVYDNTHFSYGYLTPHGNGHVSVARDGPIPSHSYSFLTGGSSKAHVKVL